MRRMLKDSRVATWYLALAAITSAVSCTGEVVDPVTDAQADSDAPYDAEDAPYDAGTDDLAVDVAIMKLSTGQCTQAALGPGYFGASLVPVDANLSRRCWMEIGDVSSAVRALQRGLKFCWWQTDLAIDGDYGNNTREAVRAVQRRLEINDDGIYGPETGAHMGDGFARADADACAVPLL